MSLTIAGVTYKDPTHCLLIVNQLIRAGLLADEPGIPVVLDLKETFRGLRRVSIKNQFEEVDRLRIETLEAEYYQQLGNHLQSARTLENEWRKLKPTLDRWSPKTPLEPSGNRRLLRQKIWVLMHYVFYKHYRVDRQHAEALRLLKVIEAVILGELKQNDYHPSGTLAICYYFMGLCYRVNRGFDDAEQSMLRAQEETYDRAKRELKKKNVSADRKRYELAYKDVVSGRILYGLAWIAFQQGQLSKAEQYLCAARNSVVESRRDYLLLLIDSLMWIVRRRKARYETTEYATALNRLKDQYQLCVDAHQLMSERCAFELIRGYLDLVEFASNDGQKRSRNIENAKIWLDKIDRTRDKSEEQRYILHRVRFFILRGDFQEAEDELDKAKAFAKQTLFQQRSALILEASLFLSRKQFDSAQRSLEEALGGIRPLADQERSRNSPVDPVLEAECCVLLARVHAAKKEFVTARGYLARWRPLGQFIDNYYMHYLAETIVPKEMPFRLEYEFLIHEKRDDGVPTIIERVKAFEKWMMRSLEERRPNMKASEKGIAFGRHWTKFSPGRQTSKDTEGPRGR